MADGSHHERPKQVADRLMRAAAGEDPQGKAPGGGKKGRWPAPGWVVKLPAGRDVAGWVRLRAIRWHLVAGRTAKRKIIFPAVLAAGLAITVGGAYVYLLPPPAYVVMVDGQRLGIVADPETVNQLLAQASQKIGDAGWEKAKAAKEVKFVPTRARAGELTPAERLQQALGEKLDWQVQSYSLVVNGKTVGIFQDEATATGLLAVVKDHYLQGKQGQVQAVAFVEKAKVVPQLVSPWQASDPEETKALLLYGRSRKETYVVAEGDSLWSIARANGLTVEELQTANPQLEAADRLVIGQEISLVKLDPLLHVKITREVEKAEAIPYPTQVKDDSSLYRGQEKVRQQGVDGEKILRYRLVENNGVPVEKQLLEEKVVREPVPKIVARGTRATVTLASRGSGSGVLAWPLSGRINSGYGYRGREFHTGIDIDGAPGDPVRAAGAGTVIVVAWNGGYGREIIVDHGNGLATRYAHLSAAKVRVGDSVARGEVIGAVGSTGRTTGPHLHFEVLVNGGPTNPFNYLR
ncbi:MAG: M23 family metallopeptidase [Clostridia bacterium]|nr:MAG: M23 family metallopeptidase [Clostridia bacterium]